MKTFAVVLLLGVTCLMPIVAGAQSTEEAFDNLLWGVWRREESSLYRFESGKAILLSAGSISKYGFKSGMIKLKDFRYIGNNRFVCLDRIMRGGKTSGCGEIGDGGAESALIFPLLNW